MSESAVKQLEQFAGEQLVRHGLAERGWTFRWNRRKTTFGLCLHSRRQIQLSRHVVDSGEPVETMRQTVLHELAHALVGPDHGHDRVWRAKAVELGVLPNRTRARNFVETSFRYYRICDACDFRQGLFRKPRSRRRMSCGRCCPGGFSAAFLLRVVVASEVGEEVLSEC